MPLINPIHPPVEETYYGVVVTDPYRWLEDRRLPETEEWIVEQRRRSAGYFADCSNLDVLRDRVREYLDIDVADEPASVAGQYFYRRRNQGQEQASIYVRNITTGKERMLVDPSDLGPFASVAIHSISQDGLLLAYSLQHGGSDRKAIHIVDVMSGRTRSDSVPPGYARGFSFASDCRGFFYCHEGAEATEDHTIRLHRLEVREDDQICFRVFSTLGSRLILTSDEIHLGAILTHQQGENILIDLWIARRCEPENWSCVFANRTLPFTPVLKRGHVFAISYDGAPPGKLVELDLIGAEIRTVVLEQEGLIRQVVMAGDRVFINYLNRTAHSIRCWNLAGTDLGCIPLPRDGTIQIMRHYGDARDSVFFTIESFRQPPTICEYRIDSDDLHYWPRRSIPRMPSLSMLPQETYSSRDGVRIPITLVAKEGEERNGPSPALMTSYGGFGVSMTPRFSVLASILMEQGSIFALPHIRGGGEFGRAWHDAARGRNRQVAFDDFIAASEWLIEKNITTTARLAIFGGSNSGLLVATAMIQRPDLFGAVLCIAPLLDMVRYESFGQAVKWQHEYGTIADPQDFSSLYAYSPYHHVEDGVNYTSVLFVSGDKDDRCSPAHVRKMAARLQNRSAQRSPVIVDYSEERGHSAVLPLSVRIEALTMRIAFLCKELGIRVAVGGCDEKACA